ncbi:PhoX family phosphatase [Arcobacter sp. CECT 8985]|uniref:PhoX family protein n=1 Tax=Arcobacter sp. CECT 8985 TaxID=1935424 RepID=UPI00100B5074|nr:alkaline phosphatase PhoX [Arcobacter sp. CECT 8985]RXJ86315.1 alkaline phosphatase [Arcobacter sp. CECT 8985]
MRNKVITASVVAASVLFTACASKSDMTNSTVEHNIKFNEVPVPTTDNQKRKIIATNQITVDGRNTNISYNTIIRSGDKVGDGIFGLLYDKNGNHIRQKDGSLRISNSNDFASLLPVGNKLFMVSHFESRPAAMYLTELKQESNGKLKAVNTKNIDFSKVNGLWVPCAGSVTPWHTHLGSEEYEPDARKIASDGSLDDYYAPMADYYNKDLKALNVYDYGWVPEISVLNEKGDVKVEKHYSMGRFAHELAYVMPDEKTVYLSDDGTNVALYMYVADKPKDLSSGTLYAAKWKQKSNIKAGSANIKWINLGHLSDEYVKAGLDQKLTFDDLFEVSDSPKEGFSSINTTMGHEYLKIKPGMEKLVSRMETRRYAAIKGATTEFRKMEGITYNPNENKVYLSISEIAKGMEDNMKKGKVNSKYDDGGNNDIRVKYNRCGAVYELSLAGTDAIKYSNDGSDIKSSYVVESMKGLIAGMENKKTDEMAKANKCSLDGLANPDNLTYIPNTNTLIIGEDTGSGHQNDFIWSYNIKQNKLTRILTSPYGSETTSPYYYNNIGGHGYLMAVIQHPYGEGDALTSETNMPKNANSVGDMKAYTGFIGPLPVISK